MKTPLRVHAGAFERLAQQAFSSCTGTLANFQSGAAREASAMPSEGTSHKNTNDLGSDRPRTRFEAKGRLRK